MSEAIINASVNAFDYQFIRGILTITTGWGKPQICDTQPLEFCGTNEKKLVCLINFTTLNTQSTSNREV